MNEIVNWLDETPTVESYEMANNFKGFVVEVSCISPQLIPKGWKITQIHDDGTVHLMEE